jgi:hypothetical protein
MNTRRTARGQWGRGGLGGASGWDQPTLGVVPAQDDCLVAAPALRNDFQRVLLPAGVPRGADGRLQVSGAVPTGLRIIWAVWTTKTARTGPHLKPARDRTPFGPAILGRTFGNSPRPHSPYRMLVGGSYPPRLKREGARCQCLRWGGAPDGTHRGSGAAVFHDTSYRSAARAGGTPDQRQACPDEDEHAASTQRWNG